jgi:hypothetical protein
MTKNRRLLMYGALAGVAYLLWKRQSAAVPATATATAPSTAVAPTAAPTTANMQALAGLSGGYGLPAAVPVRGYVRYPSPSPFQRFN